MAIPLIIPLFAGAALLGTFLFGSKAGAQSAKTPEQKKAANAAASAAKEQDWQQAVASAIASQDANTVRAVADALTRAGKSDTARELLGVIRDWERMALAKAAAARPRTRPVPTKAVVVTSPGKAPVIVAAPAKAPAKTVAPAPRTPRVRAPAKVDPKLAEARNVSDLLLNVKRPEPANVLSAVATFQRNNGLVADGLYGPASARTMWNLYKVLPVNPLRWSKRDPQGDVNSYSKFLDGIVQERPASAGRVSQLKQTLGR